jgi:hypothetical protein
MVITNFGGGDVNVLLGNGDGTFRAAAGGGKITVGTMTGPRAVLIGDFYRDAQGTLDLAVGNVISQDVRVFAGRGDGTFSAAMTVLSQAGNIVGLASADFNQDGRPDLIALDGNVPRFQLILGK